MSDVRGRPCYLHGIGTALPAKSLSAEQSAELLKQGCLTPRSAKLFQRIARLTGIEKRHLAVLDHLEDESEGLYQPASKQPDGPGMSARTALFDRAAGPLITQALTSFFADRLAHVQTLVTVTCTHAASPGLEQHVLAAGVPTTAQRWNLGFMGCSGSLAAIRLIHGLGEAAGQSVVVACELSSLHFQYTDALDQMTANALFADGAAAAMLSAIPSPVRVTDCRCVTVPAFADQMVWFAGDHGLQLRLAQALPDTLATHLPSAVRTFLRDNGLVPSDIAHWLVHPGGPQILDSVEACLRLGDGRLALSRSVLRQCGNMSSPTILFILKELIGSGTTGRAVAMAFGPGLTIELTLLEIVAV